MTSEIKKRFILGVLLIFPIVVYLFFASGKNNFAKLPVLSKDVLELDIFKSFEKRKVLLKDKITILGYWGDNLNFKKAEALNLNQKIYKRFYQFNDFQFVIIMQENKESNIESLKNELREGAGTDLLKWNFGDIEKFPPVIIKPLIIFTYESIGTELALKSIKSNCSVKQIHIKNFKRIGNSRFGDGFLVNLKILKALVLGLIKFR